MFVKVAQAAVRQAKLATFSVDSLSPTLLELFHYTTRLLCSVRMVRVAERVQVFTGASVGASVVSCYLSRS